MEDQIPLETCFFMNTMENWIFKEFVENVLCLNSFTIVTVFENRRKSLIHCERSELFTFWVDKSSLKMPKMVHFGEFLKTWSLRSNSVTRQVSLNRTKIGGKGQNSNATFWVIFKQCEYSGDMIYSGMWYSRRVDEFILRLHWQKRIKRYMTQCLKIGFKKN